MNTNVSQQIPQWVDKNNRGLLVKITHVKRTGKMNRHIQKGHLLECFKGCGSANSRMAVYLWKAEEFSSCSIPKTGCLSSSSIGIRIQTNRQTNKNKQIPLLSNVHKVMNFLARSNARVQRVKSSFLNIHYICRQSLEVLAWIKD